MSGRYSILGSIAKGGMATVYLGRVAGSAGFSRLVAIKRLHPELAAERDFVAMLVDEARLASQIRHTNVVDTLDLVVSDGAFSLVLEYVEGDSLAALLRRVRDAGETVPLPIALAILYGVLRGLDAAHDTRNEEGQPLGIVHRDVSPQNVLIGIDGVPRVIDFGVAKAIGRFDSTKPGEIRGKFSYMAPEQMQARPVTRQVDVYAAGVVLWELLVGRKLFSGEDSRVICAEVMRGEIKPPSSEAPGVPPELDAVVLRATARDVADRYLTAREMLAELEPLEKASDDDVGVWVRRLSAKALADRQRLVQGATPAADGRPIEELMKDLARSAAASRESLASAESMPPAAAPPPSRDAAASAPVVAFTAGSGLELVPESASIGGTPKRRKGVFVVALAAVALLVLVGVFVRVRPGARTASQATAEARIGAGAASTGAAPAPPPPAPVTSPAPEASASASSEIIELADVPAARKSPRKGARPRPSSTSRELNPRDIRK